MKTIIKIILLVIIQSFQPIYCQIISDENSIEEFKKNNKIRYYFYPNLDAYYDIKTSLFIYKENNQWITNETISSSYRGYSLYNNYRVEIVNYFENTPFDYLKENKKLFPYYSNNRKGKLAAKKLK